MQEVIEKEIANNLFRESENTPYVQKHGQVFKKELLEDFLYLHLPKSKNEFELTSFLHILDPNIEGVVFGRIMSSLTSVYNDTSDGEAYFESDCMGEVLRSLRVLLKINPSWSLNLLHYELSRKDKLGHFNQVPTEFDKLKELFYSSGYVF